ncbi:MAG: 2-dehydro-3-deoxygalactonokinase, partial [Sphingopyxis sp.]|nr:2-dehydro-3-deoxygalactonokinase [Sphingopyxis sp.]
ALQYLYPRADKDLLARIRNARLPQSYFGCLVQALQSSFIYDRLIISWINDLPQPELAAEVADFLMRFEEVDWAMAAGPAPSFVSGIVIACDVRTALRHYDADAVVVIGANRLSQCYADAFEQWGSAAVLVDGDAAMRTGLLAAARQAGLA